MVRFKFKFAPGDTIGVTANNGSKVSTGQLVISHRITAQGNFINTSCSIRNTNALDNASHCRRQSRQNGDFHAFLVTEPESINRTSEAQQQACQDKVDDAYIQFLKESQKIARKTELTLSLLTNPCVAKERLEPLKYWINVIHYQVGLTCRRVFDNENIPHSEKIFSFHKPYTEWISKGKAGVPVELGLRICVISDQIGSLFRPRHSS